MKVLYFHQYFTTPDGPGGSRSYKFARKLLERGHEVVMVCGAEIESTTGLSGPFVHGRREGYVDEIYVIELELPYSNHFSLLKRAIVFFRFAFRSTVIAFTEKYDLLFATSTPLTAGIPGILASFFRRKRFVFEVRDLWPELPRAMGVISNPLILGAMSLLEWLSYHTAVRCIGLSPGIVEGIRRRGVNNQDIDMIPNGCDLDYFLTGNRSTRFVDCFKSDDFIAIFAGAHGLANGLDAVLEAAAELKRRNCSNIKLLFVGDGKQKPLLMRRASEEGLDNCLFWGFMPKMELAELFGHVQVGLMILDNVPAFYYGTSPNKFFDYISAGLPVLNNYPGWLAEMIKAHDCGVVVPPDDPVAFAEALMALSLNRERCWTMGKNARKLAEVEFERGKLANQFVDCLEVAGSALAGKINKSCSSKQLEGSCSEADKGMTHIR
jgi:glycosyltransferase involved in cell wall biosynthesis